VLEQRFVNNEQTKSSFTWNGSTNFVIL